MRLAYLVIAFVVLTVSVIEILNIVVPVLIKNNPVHALYFVMLVMIMYAVISFSIVRLSKHAS